MGNKENMAFTKAFCVNHEGGDNFSYDYCDNIALMSPVFIIAENDLIYVLR
jgi:hypothetical protein